MTIEAELPDGTILEFPDGTSDNIVQNAVRSQLGISAEATPQARPTVSQQFPPQQTGGGRAGRGNRLREEAARTGDLLRSFEAGEITSQDLTPTEVEQVRKARIDAIPEITGSFSQLSDNLGFMQGLAGLTTFNPDEFGRILQDADPDIGVVTTPDGERIAINRKTDEAFSINKLGPSLMDAVQIGGVAALFSGPAAAISKVGGTVGKQTLLQSGGAGVIESGAQVSQAVLGGEFDLSDVALAATFAGGAEFLAPLFRTARDAFKALRAKDEPISKEAAIENFRSIYSQQEGLQAKLKQLGVNPKQLEATAIKALSEAPEAANPEEVIASALFKELDIPTLKSRITQQGAQFQEEQALRARPDILGEQVRERVAEEAVGFQRALTNIIDDTGLPEEAGEVIKTVLSGRQKDLRLAEKKAYKRLGKLDGQGLPVFTDRIEKTFENNNLIKRLARRDPASFKQLQDTLTEFGVLRTDEAIESFGDPSQIKPLAVDTAEDFRQALNELVDPTDKLKTGAAKQMINRLDEEVKVLDKSLEGVDLGSAGKKAKAKIIAQRTARRISSGFRGEFNEKSIVGRLTASKRGTFDIPLVEADNVVKDLISKSATKPTFANLDRVMTSLERSGKKGGRAIGNLQAATIMTLLEASTKGLSSKPAAGVVGFSGASFRKALNGIGEKELNRLFKDSPQILNTLKKLSVAAELTQPISDVMNASQSGVILKNFINDKLRAIPGLAEAAKGAADVSQRRQAQRSARKALQASFNSVKKASLSKYPKITDIIFDEAIPAPAIQTAGQAERAREETINE